MSPVVFLTDSLCPTSSAITESASAALAPFLIPHREIEASSWDPSIRTWDILVGINVQWAVEIKCHGHEEF